MPFQKIELIKSQQPGNNDKTAIAITEADKTVITEADIASFSGLTRKTRAKKAQQWFAQVAAFNQNVQVIYSPEYTYEDHLLSLKNRINAILNVIKANTKQVKSVVAREADNVTGKINSSESLDDIKNAVKLLKSNKELKKDLESLCDQYEKVFTGKAQINLLAREYEGRYPSKQGERPLLHTDIFDDAVDESIGKYRLNFGHEAGEFNSIFANHSNLNLKRLGKDIPEHIESTLKNLEAIAKKERPMWGTRWLFKKREQTYQTRIQEIQNRKKQVEEHKQTLVYLKYERLNTYLIDVNTGGQDNFTEFQKDIRDYLNRELEPKLAKILGSEKQAIEKLGFAECFSKEQSNCQKVIEDDCTESQIISAGLKNKAIKAQFESEYRNKVKGYSVKIEFNNFIRRLKALLDEEKTWLGVRARLEAQILSDRELFEFCQGFITNQVKSQGYKELALKNENLAAKIREIGLKKHIELGEDEELKRDYELKIRFDQRFAEVNLKTEIGVRLVRKGNDEINKIRTKQYFSTLKKINPALEEGAFKFLEGFLDDNLTREQLGAPVDKGGMLAGYKYIEQLNTIFDQDVQQALRAQKIIDHAGNVRDEILKKYLGPSIRDNLVIELDKLVTESATKRQAEKLRLYYHIAKIYFFKEPGFAINIERYNEFARKAEKYFFILLSVKTGEERALNEDEKSKIKTHFRNINISTDDYIALQKHIYEYIRVYDGKNMAYAWLIRFTGDHYLLSPNNDDIDLIYEYGIKRINYLLDEDYLKSFNNADTEFFDDVFGKTANEKWLNKKLYGEFQTKLKAFINNADIPWTERHRDIIEKYGNEENKQLYRLKGFKQHIQKPNLALTKEFINYYITGQYLTEVEKEEQLRLIKENLEDKGDTVAEEDIRNQISKEQLIKERFIKGKHDFITINAIKEQLVAFIEQYMPSRGEGYDEQLYSKIKAETLTQYNTQILIDTFAAEPHQYQYRLERLRALIDVAAAGDEYAQVIIGGKTENIVIKFKNYFRIERKNYDESIVSEGSFVNKARLNNEGEIEKRNEKIRELFRAVIDDKAKPWTLNVQDLLSTYGLATAESKYFVKGLLQVLSANDLSKAEQWLHSISKLGINQKFIAEKAWKQEVCNTLKDYIVSEPKAINAATYFLIKNLCLENDNDVIKLLQKFRTLRLVNLMNSVQTTFWPAQEHPEKYIKNEYEFYNAMVLGIGKNMDKENAHEFFGEDNNGILKEAFSAYLTKIENGAIVRDENSIQDQLCQLFAHESFLGLEIHNKFANIINIKSVVDLQSKAFADALNLGGINNAKENSVKDMYFVARKNHANTLRTITTAIRTNEKIVEQETLLKAYEGQIFAYAVKLVTEIHKLSVGIISERTLNDNLLADAKIAAAKEIQQTAAKQAHEKVSDYIAKQSNLHRDAYLSKYYENQIISMVKGGLGYAGVKTSSLTNDQWDKIKKKIIDETENKKSFGKNVRLPYEDALKAYVNKLRDAATPDLSDEKALLETEAYQNYLAKCVIENIVTETERAKFENAITKKGKSILTSVQLHLYNQYLNEIKLELDASLEQKVVSKMANMQVNQAAYKERIIKELLNTCMQELKALQQYLIDDLKKEDALKLERGQEAEITWINQDLENVVKVLCRYAAGADIKLKGEEENVLTQFKANKIVKALVQELSELGIGEALVLMLGEREQIEVLQKRQIVSQVLSKQSVVDFDEKFLEFDWNTLISKLAANEFVPLAAHFEKLLLDQISDRTASPLVLTKFCRVNLLFNGKESVALQQAKELADDAAAKLKDLAALLVAHRGNINFDNCEKHIQTVIAYDEKGLGDKYVDCINDYYISTYKSLSDDLIGKFEKFILSYGNTEQISVVKGKQINRKATIAYIDDLETLVAEESGYYKLGDKLYFVAKNIQNLPAAFEARYKIVIDELSCRFDKLSSKLEIQQATPASSMKFITENLLITNKKPFGIKNIINCSEDQIKQYVQTVVYHYLNVQLSGNAEQKQEADKLLFTFTKKFKNHKNRKASIPCSTDYARLAIEALASPELIKEHDLMFETMKKIPSPPSVISQDIIQHLM